MNGNVILLYSDPADPIVDVATHATGAASRLVLIGMDELASHIAPGNWPVPLRSSFPRSLLRHFERAYVINRVFGLEGSLWPRQLRAWRKHEQWLHAALQPLLASGRELAHDTGVRGASRSMLPLPVQWRCLSGQVPGVAVPRYACGMGEEQPDLRGLAEPMQKSIWSLFSWVEEKDISPTELRWNPFYVERPVGTPVICYYFGENLECIHPRGHVDIDSKLLARLVAKVRASFRSELGEMLIYADQGGGLTFQAFSPFLRSAGRHPLFAARARAWLGTLAPAPGSEEHAVVMGA